jgi:hypothetical protein
LNHKTDAQKELDELTARVLRMLQFDPHVSWKTYHKIKVWSQHDPFYKPTEIDLKYSTAFEKAQRIARRYLGSRKPL